MSGAEDKAKLQRETAEKLRQQEIDAAMQENMRRTQAARAVAAKARETEMADAVESYASAPIPDEYKSENLLRKAKELSNPSQKTFDNWQSAMMELLGLMKDLVGNLCYERDQRYQKSAYGAMKMVGFMAKELAIKVGHAASDALIKKGDVNIPEMVYDVNFKDEKLEIGALKFANGDPIDPPGMPAGTSPSQSNMKVLVTLWLNTHGYSPSSVEGKYEKPGATAGGPPVFLTQAEFERLRDSRENGLAEYLTKAVGFKHRAEKVEDLGSAPTPS